MIKKITAMIAIFSFTAFSESIISSTKCDEFITSYVKSITPDYQSIATKFLLSFSMLQTYGEARNNAIEQHKEPEIIAKESQRIDDSIASFQAQINRIELGYRNIALITGRYDSLAKKLDDSCALKYNQAKAKLFFSLSSLDAITYRNHLEFITGAIQLNRRYLDKIEKYVR